MINIILKAPNTIEVANLIHLESRDYYLVTSVIEMKIGYNLNWSGGNLRPNDSFPVTNSLRDFLLGIILSQRGNLLFFVLNNVPESMPHLE